jgi:hypothetical protein
MWSLTDEIDKPMRVFKSKWFAKFARKEGITDARLCEAVRNAEAGLIDADYGGNVIKQRVARPNEGKSGGYRTIILYRRGDKAFFVFGFPKSGQENLSDDEVRFYKDAARIVLAYSDTELAAFVGSGVYKEVKCDG